MIALDGCACWAARRELVGQGEQQVT